MGITKSSDGLQHLFYALSQWLFTSLTYLIWSNKFDLFNEYWHVRNKITEVISATKLKAKRRGTTKNIPDSCIVVLQQHWKISSPSQKKWNFAKITMYINLQNRDELENIFWWKI